MMSGESNLRVLIASMNPALSDEGFVFISSKKALGECAHLRPWALIAEAEGTTIIVDRDYADENGIAYDAVFKRITLTVHSSLEAVGLTAAVSASLAERGISANVVAGYYHDHIFVQKEKAQAAMAALEKLISENEGK
jgi:uncharacterized protein